MSALQITLVLVCSLGGLIWFVFRSKNRQLHAIYSERIEDLTTQLDTHSQQISVRSEGLNSYDFLKYNLQEALIIQSQIRL